MEVIIMKKNEYEEIADDIIENCQCGGNITNHGSWLLHLLDHIYNGGRVILSEKESGLNLFGLEKYVEWDE